MARPVDQHIHSAMKAVSQALVLDKQGNNKDAYVQYLRSVQFLVQTLIEDAQFDAVTISPNSRKFVKLGMQCMDRIGELTENIGKDPGSQSQNDGTHDGSLKHPVVIPTDPCPGPLSSSTPLPPPPRPTGLGPSSSVGSQARKSRTGSNSSRSSKSRSSQDLGPLAVAQRQNQQLMAAYKARMEKLSASSANKTNLSLSLQRRLAENMAVAKARQAALEKKMAERQKRLEAEAARRFSSTAGMSADEQERRRTYTKILEYEHDTKWLLMWREQLKMRPDDITLHNELINKILETNDHPLTQLLGRYQYAVYDKLNPLVSQHLADIQAICVPYDGPVPLMDDKDSNELKSPSGASWERFNSTSSDRSSLSGAASTPTEFDKQEPVSLEGRTSSSQASLDIGNSGSKVNAAEQEQMGFAEVCDQTQQDLEKAIKTGEKLMEKLTEENKKMDRITDRSQSEVYNVETFDDLFDDCEEIVSAEVSKSLPNMKDLDSGKTNDTAHATQDITKCEKDLGGASGETTRNKDLTLIEMQALQRHLTNVIVQVREYLEKLQAMFIIAYETLDSAAGRDLCYSCLEEPFFKPIWPYILCLFRICNQNQERLAAVSMTRSQFVAPAEFRVDERFCPTESLLVSFHKFPYEPAIVELQQVAALICPLGKLECVVRVCRIIVQCVEDYCTRQAADQEVKLPNLGADDLLPIMCYVIARSGIPQLVSECQAMEEFVHEGYLMGEEGYCLTSLQTALGYVVKLGSDPNADQVAAN